MLHPARERYFSYLLMFCLLPYMGWNNDSPAGPNKTVAFHFELGSKNVENARYAMQTLYSLDNLKVANEVHGR